MSASSAVSLYDPSREQLAELLADEPRYRVEQVWHGLYEQLAMPAELSNIPKALRQRIAETLPV
ncbi:MAG: 23S rRNA (adenine(2503)-C2)-methyltransferase, partial [Ilumatobacteraceae bacterium]